MDLKNIDKDFLCQSIPSKFVVAPVGVSLCLVQSKWSDSTRSGVTLWVHSNSLLEPWPSCGPIFTPPSYPTVQALGEPFLESSESIPFLRTLLAQQISDLHARVLDSVVNPLSLSPINQRDHDFEGFSYVPSND